MIQLSPKEKAAAGMFMTLRELAEVTGFPENRMGLISKQPGFPLFERKVRHADFEAWYRTQLPAPTAAEAAPQNETPVPLRSNGSRQVPLRRRHFAAR